MKPAAEASFFVLRTPLLPFDELLRLGADLEAAAAPADPEARARDRKRVRERMAALLERPEIQEAIHVASPSMHEAIGVWRRDAESERGRSAERGLIRYLSRAATRPTPFGLFAGCSTGEVSDRARLRLARGIQRHARLDAHYLDGLVRSLVADPEIRAQLRFLPNPSRHALAGRIRYVESIAAGSGRRYRLSTVEENRFVIVALEAAANGSALPQLVEVVVAAGASESDAESFVDELVREELLVPDLQVPLTGPPPIDQLVEDLEAIPAAAGSARVLREVRDELQDMNATPTPVPVERYTAVRSKLETLPAELEPGLLFQVDMSRPADAALPSAVVQELLRAADILRRLSPHREPEDLTRFREAFLARYDQREVPLLEALDPETGVGYGPSSGPAGSGSPLLRDLPFPSPDDETLRWTPAQKLLFRRVQEAIVESRSEVSISRADLAELPQPEGRPLPDAFDVFASISASSEEGVARGAFRLLITGVSGPSGARLLGRFCHHSAEMREHVEEHLRAEEALDPDAVFAEIVHLSQGRLANILVRPVLREYEIEYLGRSGAPPERRLPVSDLMVSIRSQDAVRRADGLAVQGDDIVLRSQHLGKRIRPRLTSAHNFGRQTLPVYRFLCQLQSAGVAGGLRLNLGPLAEAPFVPRISSGKSVLSPARWRVFRDELRNLARDDDPFERVATWRARRGLPRLVALADSDNKLVVDLENVLSVESFVRLISRRDSAVLEEVVPSTDDLCVTSAEGRYANEVIVPFVRTGPPRASRALAEIGRAVRSYTPGSEWLYVRLPTAESLADRILVDTVAPLAERLLGDGAIDRWFFIRYWDPDFHLRVRFHGEPETLHGVVEPAMWNAIAPLLESGAVRSPTIGSYEPEVERYGGPEAVHVAERVFHADSEAVIHILGMLEPGDEGAEERWRIGLAGASALAADLGMDLEARLLLFSGLARSFAREHTADRSLREAIGERFREVGAELEPLVTGSLGEDHPLQPGIEVLRRRSDRVVPLVHDLRPVGVELSDLAGSYIHMHLNRLLRSYPRAHELVIYEFLARLHRRLIESSR